MAWRLEDYVTRGEIDNRIRGCVTGRIWLAGVDEPLVLELEGNCQPDLAGCLLSFKHCKAIPLVTRPPALLQRGRTGAMSASRKVRVPDVPFEEFFRRSGQGLVTPEHLANCLYLEWFTDISGRMVIESTDFELCISAPEWRLGPEEKTGQVTDSSLPSPAHSADAFSKTCEDEGTTSPWDEFRHEQALRDSDALTDLFGRLFEKYRNHPDRDRLIAREMGWEWMVENTEETDGCCGDCPEEDPEDSAEIDCCGEWLKPAPDPTREGVDWVRSPEGEIRHPLYDRAVRMTTQLYAFCRDGGLMEEECPELEELFTRTNLLAAKLAGALTDLADGTNLYEPGFVVALLKRALKVLNQALAALSVVEAKSLLPEAMIDSYQVELLSIREAMLTLIYEFRRRVS